MDLDPRPPVRHPGRRRSTPWACLGLSALSALACGTTGAGRVVETPEAIASAGAEAAFEGRRQLFRVAYQGPEGGGSLRLALSEAGPGFYQARASDSFGRAVWSLELAGATAVFVDHRQGLFCRTDASLRLPELALGALPLDRLPAMLAGELPATPTRPAADPADFRDPEGRRWTAARAGGELEAWTLWDDEGPLLWWKRHERGGILSHRGGAQFRWRRSLAEARDGELPEMAVPAGYLAADCSDLRAVPPG